MQTSTAHSRIRGVAGQGTWVTLFALGCLGFAWADVLQGVLQGVERWRIGDWLIHWESGPVRRGLWGQALMWLTPGGSAQIWVSFVAQSLLLFASAAMVLKLFFGHGPRKAAWLLLLFNPAFLFLFVALDPGGALRKESLFFFSFLCLIQGIKEPGRWHHRWLCLSAVVYAVGVMSHELGSLCVPFFLLVLWQHAHALPQAQFALDRRPAILYGAGFVALAIGGLAFSAAYPGSASLATEMCNVLKQRGIDGFMCTGAIDWLKVDSREAFAKVQADWPVYRTVYPALLALSLLPLLLVDWVRRHGLVLLFCFLALTPLFVFARDWGRWIHLYVFFTTITVFWLSGRTQLHIVPVPWWGVAAFVGLWRLPYVDAELPLYDALFRSLMRAMKATVPLVQQSFV